MKEMIKSILNRLNNRGTILALAGLIVSLICQFGVQIDSQQVLGIVETICSILVILGVLNSPIDNQNMYIPYVSDKLVDKDKENK